MVAKGDSKLLSSILGAASFLMELQVRWKGRDRWKSCFIKAEFVERGEVWPAVAWHQALGKQMESLVTAQNPSIPQKPIVPVSHVCANTHIAGHK